MQLEKMTPRQLAARCIMPRLNIDNYFADFEYKESILALVDENIGGFCLFGGSILSAETLTSSLQSRAVAPLIFSADFEHGLPMRFSDGTQFPQAMALGRLEDSSQTRDVAAAIAKEAKSAGINWNFAPVADINSNRKNPVINIRSFGENPEIVSKHAAAYILGTQMEKVIATAKHFPGHGDTSTNSHLSLPVLMHSRERLESHELLPFIEAIKNGVKSIMVGHLAVPSLDSSMHPATLSSRIINELLRRQLGFKGIIITDAMDMKSITSSYSSGEAAILAKWAGNDIILLPENPMEAIAAMEAEAIAHPEFLDALLESAKLVYKEMRWCGLTTIYKTLDSDNKVSFPEHEKLAFTAALGALELVGDKSVAAIADDIKIGGFAFVDGDEMDNAMKFFNYLAAAIENDMDFGFINSSISDDEIDSIKENLPETDLYIFTFFVRGKAYKGTVEISENIQHIIDYLSGGNRTLAIFFGSPYLIDYIKTDCYIRTFTDSLCGIAASAALLRDLQNDIP